jgi:amidohydrolase
MKYLALQAVLEDYFHWFHRHPERSYQEKETTARIKEILGGMGVEILDTGLVTGAVACIRGGSGPTVALRCDIDALPLTETSGLSYASEHEGCMHACGHDFHLTAMLGAAHLLRENRDKLNGTVKLIFQPAEELAGGAEQVLATGALEDVREIYGLHVSPELAPATVAVCAGPTNAAAGILRIRITGKGGHAGYPHLCVDPIIAQAQLINALQTLVSRNTDPFSQAVISITRVTAGTTWNIIPPEALLEGTVRTFKEDVLDCLSRRIHEVCRGIGESSGTVIEPDLYFSSAATDNDPLLAEFVADTARERGMTVVKYTPSMGGEDFSLYQKRIPGVFWFIGVGSPHPLHHPQFVADPSGLQPAAELLAALGSRAPMRTMV